MRAKKTRSRITWEDEQWKETMHSSCGRNSTVYRARATVVVSPPPCRYRASFMKHVAIDEAISLHRQHICDESSRSRPPALHPSLMPRQRRRGGCADERACTLTFSTYLIIVAMVADNIDSLNNVDMLERASNAKFGGDLQKRVSHRARKHHVDRGASQNEHKNIPMHVCSSPTTSYPQAAQDPVLTFF